MPDIAPPPDLLARAQDALRHSYSPYSNFPVAAAVLTASGRIFAAPNIENASFGLTVCAERNAIFQAVASGERQLRALLLFTPTIELFTPCGACRQVIAEFMADDCPVFCVAGSGGSQVFTAGALLPAGFALRTPTRVA